MKAFKYVVAKRNKAGWDDYTIKTVKAENLKDAAEKVRNIPGIIDVYQPKN